MNPSSENSWDQTTAKEIFGALWKGKFIIVIITAFAVIASMVFSFFVIPEQYEAFASLTVMPITLKMTDYGHSVAFIDYLATFPMNTKADYMQYVKSSQVLEEAIKRLDLRDDSGNLMSATVLSNSINIVDSPSTYRIDIRVTHSDPVKASQIANTVSQCYKEFVADLCNSRLQETKDLIADQLLAEGEILDERKRTLNEYRLNNKDLSVLKGERDTLIGLIIDSQSTILKKETQISADLITMSALGATSLLEDRIDIEEFDLSIDINSDLDKAGVNQVNIDPDDLDTTLDSIYVNKLKNRIIADQAIKQTLEQRVDELQIKLIEAHELITEDEHLYNKVYADKEFSQTIYNIYEQRYREVSVYSSSNFGDTIVSISADATPGVKTGPNETKNIAVASMVGLCLGVFVVLFVNYIKKMKKSSQD